VPKYKFGDVVREIKINIDRNNNPYEFYIAGEHMDTNELHLQRRGTFEGSDVGPAFIRLFKPGQILYGSRRTYLRKVAVADFEGITSNTTFVLESKDETKLCQRLLPFIMLSDDFTQYSISKSKGSTNPYILFSDLSEYELDLPEIEQQRALADILWALDDTKKAYRNLIISTDELVKSQFIEMFGDPNNATNTALLTDALEIRDDLRKPLNDAVRADMHHGTLYPYYGANGMVDEINEYITDYTAICLAEDCGAYGPGEASGYIIRGKAWVNNHAHVLIPKENCNIVYANEYFRLLDITSRINGSTRAKLTQAAMRQLPFLLPPLKDQERFAAFVEQSDKSKLMMKNIYLTGGKKYVTHL